MLTLKPLTEDEVQIEIVGRRNENLLFPPTRKVLRGRYQRMNLPPGATSISLAILSAPDHPGLMICLSTSAKRARIVDPLGFDENKTLAEMVAKTHKVGVQPTVEYELTDDQVATWLYWIGRHVRDGMAELVRGDLNQKVKGRIKVDPFATASDAPRYRDEFIPDGTRAGKQSAGG